MIGRLEYGEAVPVGQAPTLTPLGVPAREDKQPFHALIGVLAQRNAVAEPKAELAIALGLQIAAVKRGLQTATSKREAESKPEQFIASTFQGISLMTRFVREQNPLRHKQDVHQQINLSAEQLTLRGPALPGGQHLARFRRPAGPAIRKNAVSLFALAHIYRHVRLIYVQPGATSRVQKNA